MRAAIRTKAGPPCSPGAGALAGARRAGAALLATAFATIAAFAVAVFALPVPQAHAADSVRPAAGTGYRYWSFWQRDDSDSGSWAYATEGPATQRPDDGDTLGFRFALSEDSQQAAKPRGTPTFAAACEKTEPEDGSKRVAVRIDFGTRADAPASESGAPPAPRTRCALVPEKASAAEVLAEVASPLRYGSGSLLCAIDHYPAKGCGEQAGGDASSENGDNGENGGDGQGGDRGTRSDEGSGSHAGGEGMSSGLGLTAGVAAVAILGLAAFWQARRRRR
ncbi:SCO2322 family protein [Streptomyces tubbatahanensis]|uniref:SCO2322 family protein n=1 Tax=Streptomyces tubbatahanensis TaxID=2923272 RepID=A0ABY3XR06_9ACTN|nr:SCO2322 family protein [Streptomyces tubbatahanensis]UNS96831.1 SCO2322 family protein [Streptomyces tubbatahanensis]